MATDPNAFSEHVLAMKYRYKAAGLFGFYLKDGCEQCAKQLGVVTVINDQVDQASWEHAIQRETIFA